MAPHSSTLAWKIPWTKEPSRLQSMGRYQSDTTEKLHFHFSLSCIGEGNGNPPECSCLENPRDGGAWWAAIYGVARSRTRLKRLSSSSSSTMIFANVVTGGGPDVMCSWPVSINLVKKEQSLGCLSVSYPFIKLKMERRLANMRRMRLISNRRTM